MEKPNKFIEKDTRVAVVGATGLVGREMIEILEERQFPLSSLTLLASENSSGQTVEFMGGELTVQTLNENSFDDIDIALFSAGSSISEKFAPIAKNKGAIVIDNSSHFRLVNNVPLIVPEVNSSHLREVLSTLGQNDGLIIANPNCSTIQLAVVLKPLNKISKIKRVIISTYQSVSGAGKKGMDELWDQTLAIYNQGDVVIEKFSKQIAFNVIPHCDIFTENGYTKEEMKLVNETRKILNISDLKISATAVRVPVFSCHSESVNIEFEDFVSQDKARTILRESPGIVVLDAPEDREYPTATELSGTDSTYVGRIREDISCENGLSLWIVADNLRKGAALNAIQIAEIVISSRQPH